VAALGAARVFTAALVTATAFGLDDPSGRFAPRPRAALTCGIAAAVGAAFLAFFGPPGADVAAHVYQRDLFIHHGFAFWNNFWYAGRYSFVSYSPLYYPVAALLGIELVAITSATIAAYAFAVVAERQWGAAARRPAYAFAAACAASVLTGAFPYALGFALALTALATLQSRRLLVFAAVTALTFAASPLAFVLLAIVLAGVAAARSWRGIALPATAVVFTSAIGVVLWRIFPSAGRYPFSVSEFAAAAVFCAIGLAFTWRVERARILRFVFAAYACACVVVFAIPSSVGENIVRLRYVAVPLALLTFSLRAWRPVVPAAVTLLLAFSWNVTPLAASFAHGSADPSARAQYWRPVIRYLKTHLDPSYRVEAVDTVGHWEAVYLARAGIPIVRGWFRQDDFPQNELLYDHFGRRAYLSWLRNLGVRYVVLTDAPSDYSARAEASLVRSGRSGLRAVFSFAHGTIYRVPAPAAIIVGPGRPRILALGTESVRFVAPAPARYRLSIRYSPYWSTDRGCVRRRRDGMMDVVAREAGVIELRFRVTAGRALATLVGQQARCGDAVGGAATRIASVR
jgi:hypothetical protein